MVHVKKWSKTTVVYVCDFDCFLFVFCLEVERFSISLKNITPPCKNFKFRDQRYKVDFEIKNHHRTIEMLFVSEAKYDKNSVYKSYGETKVNHNRFLSYTEKIDRLFEPTFNRSRTRQLEHFSPIPSRCR